MDNELAALNIEVTSIVATESTRLKKPIKVPRPGQQAASGAARSGVANIPDEPIKQAVSVLAATSRARRAAA